MSLWPASLCVPPPSPHSLPYLKLQDPEFQQFILVLCILDLMFQSGLLRLHLFYLKNRKWMR